MPPPEVAQEEALMIEEAACWLEYLEATRSESGSSYAELEKWEWARLRQQLRSIRDRRAKLRPAAS